MSEGREVKKMEEKKWFRIHTILSGLLRMKEAFIDKFKQEPDEIIMMGIFRIEVEKEVKERFISKELVSEKTIYGMKINCLKDEYLFNDGFIMSKQVDNSIMFISVEYQKGIFLIRTIAKGSVERPFLNAELTDFIEKEIRKWNKEIWKGSQR